MKFVDLTISKKALARIISYIYRQYGQEITVSCLDSIKELGFHFATISGITIDVYKRQL